MWTESSKSAQKFCKDLGFEMNIRGFFDRKRGDWSAYGYDKTIMVYYDDSYGRVEFHIKTADRDDRPGNWHPIAFYYFESENFESLMYNYPDEFETYLASPEDFYEFFDVNSLY